MYPNGAADVNHFHAAGGMAYVISTLLENGLLHENVQTIIGKGLKKYTQEPKIEAHRLIWVEGPKESLNKSIIRSASDPFSKDGGIKILQGNLGRSVIKTAAVEESHRIINAPAIVFLEQQDLIDAFKKDELNKDFIAVLPFQGPKQNGMPELHQLTPTLTILQKRGYKVALVTDGRMSGASGKVPAAIHLWPEAKDGGLIAKIRTGDLLHLDANNGELYCDNFEEIVKRIATVKDNSDTIGYGRELFTNFRSMVSSSEEGASVLF
jgi:phosphogluconate dehydratase